MTPTLPWGPALDSWFQQLDAQGFRTGVRERLLVQTLLVRQAAAGQLPESLEATLASVAALLCTSAEQQRRYGQLLKAFVAQQNAVAKPSRPRSQLLWIGLFILVLVLAAGLGWKLSTAPAPAPAVVVDAGTGGGTGDPGPGCCGPSPGLFVPALPLPIEPGGLHPTASAARPVLAAIAAIAGFGLLWAAWIRHRRRILLKHVPTDDEIEQHFFREKDALGLAPPASVLRPVSVALRQRVAGETAVLDIAATLRATAATLGALSLRWRQLRRTPEYLALVDTRHPSDLLSACGHALLTELARLGVTLHVYGFDGSPAGGCWVHGAVGNDDPATRRRIPFSVVATRHQNHRLFVIGNADAAMLAAKGGPQPWVQSVSMFAERVWLTPQPLATWGAAEFAADDAGFLVLPLQDSALPTLASWLTSRRLSLAQSPDDPRSYPRLLSGSELEWVIRSDPPPPEVVRELLAQVRAMLGGTRFQWFCACAAFPALTPPLTGAFGKLVLPDDEAAIRRGMPVLAALPWFRYGRMPEWLRKELLGQLAPDFRRALIEEVDRRLDAALSAGDGQEVARIATRLERRAWALEHRIGPLQDVVLAEFMQGDGEIEPVSEVGDKLRRRLFRGRDDREWRWRPVPLVAGLLCLAVGVVALTPLWNMMFGTGPQVAELPQRVSLADAGWRAGSIRQPKLAAASENLIVVTADGLPPMTIDFARPQPRTLPLVFNVDAGQSLAIVTLQSNSLANAIRIADDGLALELTGSEKATAMLSNGSRMVAAAFTPSGSRIVALTEDGSVHTWGRPWPTRSIAVVDCAATDIEDAVRLAHQLVQRMSETGATQAAVSADRGVWWQLISGMEQPSAGVVNVWAVENESFALELSQRASAATGSRFAVRPSIDRDTHSSRLLPTAAVGVCAESAMPPTGPPELLREQPLRQRVEAMFAGDRNQRLAATDNLRQERVAHAAAVPLALRRAMVAQQAGGAPSELDGVINTLVLLKFVAEPILRSNAKDIEVLLDSAEKNGTQTASHVRDVRLRLAKVLSKAAPPLSGASGRPVDPTSRAVVPPTPGSVSPPILADIDEAALPQIAVIPTRLGLDLIAKYEGFAALPTSDDVVGYGHQLTPGERKTRQIRIGSIAIPLDRPMDLKTARTLLAIDLQPIYRGIAARVMVPLSAHQRDALTSFAYNAGSTRAVGGEMLTELNNGNYEAVPQALIDWRKNSLTSIRAQDERRRDEAALWRTRD